MNKKFYCIAVVLGSLLFSLEARYAPETQAVMQSIISTLQDEHLTVEKWAILMDKVHDYIERQYYRMNKSKKHVFSNGSISVGYKAKGTAVLPMSSVVQQLDAIFDLGKRAINDELHLKSFLDRGMLYDKAYQQVQADTIQISSVLNDVQKIEEQTRGLAGEFVRKHDIAEVLVRLVSSLHNAVVPGPIYS